MTDRYHVHFDGPDTAITSAHQGPWPRWSMARASAIEHLEQHVAECEKTLMCVGRAASFTEYMWLRGEMVAGEVV